MPAGYNQGTAVGINDNGVTIGQALAPSGSGLSQKRVVWLSGIPFDINNLTLPGSPSIGSLLKLNQAGQLLQGGGARVITPLDQLPEDINGDCAVDGSDIAKLLADWGPREWSIADIDGDGVVNGFDLRPMPGAWKGSK